MLIVEIDADSPIIQRAFEEAPGMQGRTQHVAAATDRPTRFLFWAWGGDFDAFERGMDVDPTVQNPELLTVADGRRLYHVEYTELGQSLSIYPAVYETHATVLSTDRSEEGRTWEFRLQFPTHERVSEFFELVGELEVTMTVTGIYTADGSVVGDDLGLTDVQRETLVRAVELGFFEVPRRVTMEELAADLGITTQAASVRLRNGHATLVDNTLLG